MDNYHYGIVGNCQSAALVDDQARLVWLCLPYFDSPSVFGHILDDQKGGYFQISGVNTLSRKQEYLDRTGVLKTLFETTEGIFEIYDYMPRFPISNTEFYCPSEVHRKIRVVAGHPKIRVDLKPAPNYAQGDALIEINRKHLKIKSTAGHYNSYYLYSNLDLEAVCNGEEITLEKYSFFLFTYHEKIDRIDNDKIYLEYEKTKTYWLDWCQRTSYPQRYKDDVIRSAITLKMLMYERTGAVVAAATTSLPEIIGRDRNWDYRYCWIRDAAMIIDLYVRIGHRQSAEGFITFILDKMQLKHEDIRVMYGINGEEILEEKNLDHLRGYANSKPVRIGNAAYTQKQNDLYGELIETIYTYFVLNPQSSFQVNEEVWTMVRSLVNRVEEIWRKPDSGIWERREALQHYVHSKLMCWVAVDRAIKFAKHIGKPSYVERWQPIAEDIREDILKNGWNENLNAFTMYYGSEIHDASNLLMLHYGFLSPKDPRMVSTVKEAYKHLVKDGFTFRYIDEDEFGRPENAFIVCTFWMINALFLIGEEKTARDMFENIRSCANHLGLFAEDVEIATRRLTGNFPQGYSHLAFIQTALLLETDYNWSDTFKFKSPQYFS